MRLLVAVLLALLGVTESPQRVIVQVDHLQKIEGVILGQSEDGLHIRTRAGEKVLVNPETAFQIVLLMDVEQPEQVIVHMRDGRQIRGLLHTDGWDAVKVDVHGVMLTLGRKDVAFVQPAPDIAALYEASRSALADSDEHGRLALARWLITQKAWALAQSELQSLVDTFDNIEAAALLPMARAQAAAAQGPVTTQPPPDTVAPVTDASAAPVPHEPTPAPEQAPAPTQEQPDDPTPPGPLPPNAGLPPLPTPDIVHLQRVLELNPTNPPPLTVPESTRRRLHLGWSGSRLLPDTPEALEALLAMPDAQALQLLFDLRARPLYNEVQVDTPPPALQTFARAIHDGWLTTRCGTRTCHGGPDAGRFRLYRSSSSDDRVHAANLLQLERATFDDRPMLDWTTPANSLLIQHALPRAMADTPHPRTPGWRPVLNGEGLETTLRWMRAMRRPRPTVPWPPEPEPAADPPPSP